MAISRAGRYQAKRRRYRTNKEGGRSRYERGFYKPINEDKYKKPLNTYMNKQEFPEYRSSWEKKFMKWCDLNSEIEYWTAEPFAIEYISPKDNKKHRYFPDFLIKFKDGKKRLIEIKPQSQWNDPINVAKWESARKFCKFHNLEFVVLGQKELGV